eukprot:scaffold37917_cov17-Prasinocladus_malaysianus.AAC.1
MDNDALMSRICALMRFLIFSQTASVCTSAPATGRFKVRRALRETRQLRRAPKHPAALSAYRTSGIITLPNSILFTAAERGKPHHK